MSTQVHSLKTAQTVAVYSLPPKEAVVAAYRQLELKDFNWWQENSRVPPVEEGESFYFCGHFAARKLCLPSTKA